jgi:hypothetical protein
VNRRIFAFLGLAVLLAGCKDPEAQGGSGTFKDTSNEFVRAGNDVIVKKLKIYPATSNSVQGDAIYLVTFNFTNTIADPLQPRLEHFVLEDESKVRHTALDGGSPILAGINNDYSPMKKGEARDFTVGFNVYQSTTGALYYDPT